MDEFAGKVIALAVRALRHDPTLWERFNNYDNILFTRQDFLDTAQSKLFAALLRLGNSEIAAQASCLKKLCDYSSPLIGSALLSADYAPPGTRTRRRGQHHLKHMPLPPLRGISGG